MSGFWDKAKQVGEGALGWASGKTQLDYLRKAVGMGDQTTPDLSKGPDAQAARAFGATLRNDYQDRPDTISTNALSLGTAATPMLKAAAEGTAPSAAQSLYRQATDEAQKSALGRAATLQGSSPGLAMRAGLDSGNQAVLGAAAGGAALRASEQATARDAYEKAIQNQAQNYQNIGQANQSYALGAGNLAASETNAPLNAAQAAQQLQLQQQQLNNQNRGAFMGGLGQGLMALSDRRAKQNVSRKSLADALADNVHGVTFDYKPEFGGAKHFGVIAQDVEKVIPGAVKKRPDGLREISAPELSTANTAVISELASRLRRLEGKAAR